MPISVASYRGVKQAALVALLFAGACRTAPTPARSTPAASADVTPTGSASPTNVGDNTGLIGTYDNNNAFARIIRGELPASKVYEDDHVLAFMPLRMISRGHVLVISKTSKARNLLDIEPEELTRVMNVARRVARAQMRALGVQGFQILQNNGAVGTQSVFHLHVHVIPRYPGVDLLPAAGPSDDRKVLDEMAARLRAAMQ